MLAMMEGSLNKPTQLLPKEDVAVVIWGDKITDDISHTIRFQASKEEARKYWGNKKKNLWPNKHFDKVNWEHLDLVHKNKPNMYKVWRSKQNSRFCGTRVQVGLYLGTTLPIKRYPSCGRREMADHLLLCSNEDRTQLLIENADKLERWLERDGITDPELSYWISKYILMRGAKPLKELGAMSPCMKEPRYHWLLQVHGRVHFVPFLRNTELSLGHVQQLPQWNRLGKAIHLNTPTCATTE
jgi:hypothetical protein